MTLDTKQKRALAAQAHNLKPIVLMGSKGLTDALLEEAARALYDHELIKLKLAECERDEKQALAEEIAQSLDAEVIQIRGHHLTLYKPSDKD